MMQSFNLLALTGTATDANGSWRDASQLQVPFTLQVSGAGAGDVVVINGSCAVDKPADASHEVQLASVNADGFTTVSTPLRWIKARKAAATQSSTVALAAHTEK